jgi:hypothetical protein
MASITIKERAEVVSLDPSRAGKYDLWITYQFDDGRTDMVIVPKETATEASIIAAVKVKEAERGKLVGKTLSL